MEEGLKGGDTKVVLGVLTVAAGRAKLLPRKVLESSAFSFFTRANVTACRFAVRKEGTTGPRVIEGSSPVPWCCLGPGPSAKIPFNLCVQASSPNKLEGFG